MGLSPLHISFSPLYFQDLTEPRLNWKLVIESERLSIMRFNAIIVPALLASSALAQSSSSTDMDPSMIMSSTDMDPSMTMPSSMEMSSTVLQVELRLRRARAWIWAQVLPPVGPLHQQTLPQVELVLLSACLSVMAWYYCWLLE